MRWFCWDRGLLRSIDGRFAPTDLCKHVGVKLRCVQVSGTQVEIIFAAYGVVYNEKRNKKILRIEVERKSHPKKFRV